MASEITVNGTLTLRNTSTQQTFAFSPGPTTVTQVATAACGGVQIVGTATEALVVGDVTSPGWLTLRNLHTAVSLEIGSNTSSISVFGLLLPGEYAIMPLGITAVAVRASHTSATNTVNVQYMFHSR